MKRQVCHVFYSMSYILSEERKLSQHKNDCSICVCRRSGLNIRGGVLVATVTQHVARNKGKNNNRFYPPGVGSIRTSYGVLGQRARPHPRGSSVQTSRSKVVAGWVTGGQSTVEHLAVPLAAIRSFHVINAPAIGDLMTGGDTVVLRHSATVGHTSPKHHIGKRRCQQQWHGVRWSPSY